jgi:hypothetical protein
MNAGKKKSFALGLSLLLTLAAPPAASAQRHGGGARAAAPARVSAPQIRSAAPSRGFDLREDTAPPLRQSTPLRQAAAPPQSTPQRFAPVTVSRQGTAPHAPAAGHRPALATNLGYGGGPGGHRIIGDPRYHGGNWGWNHGVTWNPAPRYWGGGFWGPWALGLVAASAFGAIYYDDGTLDSYQVEPDSPGAELLENYQLTQVPCGPPDLVVILGPDNGVICADPNDLVAAGEYQLDPADLTIVALDS